LDAEGCIYINKNNLNKFYISITQKNHPKILYYIKNYLNFGKIDIEKKYKIYCKNDCLKFIELVKDYLIVKYKQLIYFKDYLLTNNYNIKYEIYNKCNIEKHVSEIYNNINVNNNNKDAFYYKLKIIEIKNKILIDIIENNYILKSIYEEIIYIKKQNKKIINKINDKLILQVKKLIHEGKKNIEIEKLLNIKRHIISRIKNNIIICKNEEKIIKIKITQEEKNINKRKINIEIICKVIDKIIKNKKPFIILNEINNENKCNKLTIDIIKNIKRKIKANIIPFYKIEVNNETYNYYKKIINDYYLKI